MAGREDKREDETAGRTGGEGTKEEIRGKKDGAEEVKRKRDRPPKVKVSEKGEGKSLGSLLKYLEETKSAGETSGFVEKGWELRRTPVKQLAAEGTTAVNGEEDSEETRQVAAVQQEVGAAESNNTEGLEKELNEALDVEEGAEEVDEPEINEVSVGMNVWMREIGDRLKGAEVKLEKLKETIGNKNNEIAQLKYENKCRDIVIEGLNRRVGGLKEVMCSMADKIEEMESEKSGKRGRVGSGGTEEGSWEDIVDSRESAEWSDRESRAEAGMTGASGEDRVESVLSEAERSRRVRGGGRQALSG